MPLNKKGKKIMSAMKKEFGYPSVLSMSRHIFLDLGNPELYNGEKKGKAIFYASENKGTIKGIKKKK